MAFKDITKVMYDGSIKIDYKDKAHRYYARERVDFKLPEDDKKAWGKIMYPKGTTTLIGDVMEKNGLMTWPMGLALRELFGFYDFTNEEGKKMTGFSKDVGEMWNHLNAITLGKETTEESKERLLPVVLSASKAWVRKKKKGADIGSVVHDAIEHYITQQDFDIAEQYMWSIKEAWPLPEQGEKDEFEGERNLQLEQFEDDVAQATEAFKAFVKWWEKVQPTLYGTEDILYSKEFNVCGTYDGDLGIPLSHHPVPEWFQNKQTVRVVADWKTSNASKSKSAAMPQGVNYQYFIQDAIYELMRREMGLPEADDLLVVSARKDGGFDTIFASELGLTIDECLEIARNVINMYKFVDKTKKALLARGGM